VRACRKFGSASFWMPAYRKVIPRNARSTRMAAGCARHVLATAPRAGPAASSRCGGGGALYPGGAERWATVPVSGPAVGGRSEHDSRTVRTCTNPGRVRDHHGVRILVVEDDHRLANLLATRLHREGHDVDVAYTGPDGVDRILSGKSGLAVLDVML